MRRFLQVPGYRPLLSPFLHLRTMASSTTSAKIIDGTAIAKCVVVFLGVLRRPTLTDAIPQIYSQRGRGQD